METTTTRDAVAFLKDVFQAKTKANPRLSLRAFAQQMGLSPGGLSQILGRKKKLSYDRAYEIVGRLKLSKKDADLFLTLIELDSTRSLKRKAEILDRLSSINKNSSVHNLNVDQFKLISSWTGLAILQMVTDCDPTLSNQEIAKRLNIGIAEVDATLERLERLDLIQPSKPNPRGFRFKGTNAYVMFTPKDLPEVLKKYYQEVSQKADEAVATQTPDERVSGSQVFAFDPVQIEELRTLTDNFLNALNAMANKGKNRTEVYQAVTHVFRLTDMDKTNKKISNGSNGSRS